MSLLALGAIFISVHESSRLAFFNQPTAVSPTIQHEYLDDVTATLRAPSFLERFGDDGTVLYQAPNRTDNPFDGFIVIGAKTFFDLESDGNDGVHWGELHTTKFLDDLGGPASVRGQLSDLLYWTCTARHGDTFSAEQVVDSSQVFPGGAGEVLLRALIRVQNRRLASVRITGFGYLPSFKNEPGGKVKSVVVRSEILATMTYSKFGDIKPIVEPNLNETKRLFPCNSDRGITIGSTRYCW